MKSIRNVLAGTLLAGGALLTAAASFSVANAADESTAMAAPGDWSGHFGHRHGWGQWHLYRQLGLTAEQQASIKAIMTAAKPQMKSLHMQMQANHQKLMQIEPDDPNYGNVVAEVAQSNAALAAQGTNQASEIRTQMYALLTPAQKTQLAGLEAQMAAKAATRTPPQ